MLSHQTNGRVVAFMGLPGSGKSTLAALLAPRIPGCRLFLEPNEANWPDAVLDRHNCGYFTALSWFRAMRVPQLFAAHTLRLSGTTAVLDSYYDALIACYIDTPQMRWLLPHDDPYFPAARLVASLDWQLLPVADIIVFVDVTHDQWRALLRQRSRDMDSEAQFLDSYSTQEVFLAAAHQYSRERGTVIVSISQSLFEQELVCQRLCQQLAPLLPHPPSQ
ncbi:MAG: AAA family ATPase [Phycisphaerales bacterium]|nr:AAA family ATPase [Phycisphaerales bacterium]